jgi:hypothetical protein
MLYAAVLWAGPHGSQRASALWHDFQQESALWKGPCYSQDNRSFSIPYDLIRGEVDHFLPVAEVSVVYSVYHMYSTNSGCELPI